MSRPLHIVCPWVTPKIFPDFANPEPRVKAFFDAYAELFAMADTVAINFASGNGDQVLKYAGMDSWDEGFDWGRYNAFGATKEVHFEYNRDWIKRVREGGERSYNPYMLGPYYIASEEKMTYRVLASFYECFRKEAKARGINLKLMEYLEPGPEFCPCTWKTERHPEATTATGDTYGREDVIGEINVCSTLNADSYQYAAYPNGIPAGTNTGDFVATQAAAYVNDFGLDGVYLGNQFGLLGFWHPASALEPTPERRAGVKHFFHKLRETMGDKLIYWMDTYWPADVEIKTWAMSEENYAQLDAVMLSNFAVIVERTQIIPNLESKVRISKKYNNRRRCCSPSISSIPGTGAASTLMTGKISSISMRFTASTGKKCQGISFFANDTFGQFVPEQPLSETLQALRDGHSV